MNLGADSGADPRQLKVILSFRGTETRGRRRLQYRRDKQDAFWLGLELRSCSLGREQLSVGSYS